MLKRRRKLSRDGVLEDMASRPANGVLGLGLGLGSQVLGLGLGLGKKSSFLVSCDHDHHFANVRSHRCVPPMNGVALVLGVRTLPAKYLYLHLWKTTSDSSANRATVFRQMHGELCSRGHSLPSCTNSSRKSSVLLLHQPQLNACFSHSGLFMRPHRARMGDRMLVDLVFFKCNKHTWLTIAALKGCLWCSISVLFFVVLQY